ncbi:MAG: MBL fold metallo-hydrolase [Nakamurella sp.]
MPARSWTDLTDTIRVCHSSKYLTASTVLRRDDTVVLVDPAWTPAELASLATDLAGWQLRVTAGFSTHAHHDHLLWHPGFGPAPRYASVGATALASKERAALVGLLGESFPVELVELMGQVEPVDQQRPTFWPAAELVTHDAHSTGHTAVWLADERVLLAGDMLSDVELPLPHETGLAAYDDGLTALRPYVEQAEILVPGHGTPSRAPMDRWLADRRYLDAVLAGTDPDDERRSDPDMEQAHVATLAMTH